MYKYEKLFSNPIMI